MKNRKYQKRKKEEKKKKKKERKENKEKNLVVLFQKLFLAELNFTILDRCGKNELQIGSSLQNYRNYQYPSE